METRQKTVWATMELEVQMETMADRSQTAKH